MHNSKPEVLVSNRIQPITSRYELLLERSLLIALFTRLRTNQRRKSRAVIGLINMLHNLAETSGYGLLSDETKLF